MFALQQALSELSGMQATTLALRRAPTAIGRE
jgi:hypothetical protein